MCSRGSVNELVHTSRSVKEDGKRDGGGEAEGDGERREGGIDRKQMEKNTAEIVHTKKKPKQVGGRESVKLGSHGGWGW